METEKQKMDTMKTMMSNPALQGGNEMEMMIQMAVQQAKLSDKMFFTYGVEEDDFNAAVMKYDLMNHPAVRKMMQESMQALGMGGGMGGMGGPMMQ